MRTKTIRAALAAICVAVMLPSWADGARRPMALMIMVDGLRADGVDSGLMPNLDALRLGKWQDGYKAAWSLTAHIAPGSVPSSAPNHISIATGYAPATHGGKANGQTASVNYTAYPTWLKRVVDVDPGKSALFVYSWSEDADLGPADNVEFIGAADNVNAATLSARLAAADAPDATMYFINLPDEAGHSDGFYPMSSAYRDALATTDGYIGACLSAIANRATFDQEDWLVMVTSDHGGYKTYHGEINQFWQAHTVPLVIAGRGVAEGRMSGVPNNYDVCASALGHFGITVSGLQAVLRSSGAAPDAQRLLSDGLAVYLPFDAGTSNQITDSGVTVEESTATPPAVTANGFTGSYLNIPSGAYLKLAGSENLTYEGGDKSFTAIVWVNVTTTPTSDPVVIGNKNWSGNAKGVLLCHGKAFVYSGTTISNQRSSFSLNAGTGKTRLDMGPFDQENGKWTFYAITRSDDGVFTTYQGRSDGTLDWASATLDGFVLKNYPFYVGQDGTGNYGNKFVGGVDDVALWTRGLSHDEIRRIFESGRAGVNLGDLLAGETHDAPEMEVASYDGDTVALSFGGRRTGVHRLYVAYGAADGGEDKYAWVNFDFVADIAAGATSYSYAVPQAFKDNGYRVRFFLMKTDSLPYAKEVAWAHSDGGAWIDAGVAPRRDLVAEFDARLTADNVRDNGTTAAQNAVYENFFGAFGVANDKKSNYGLCRYHYTRSAQDETWDREYNTGASYHCVGSCTLDTDYHVVFTTTGLSVNGVGYGSNITAVQFVESGWPIALYRNLRLGVKYDQTMIGYFKNFSLYTPVRKVRSYRPVTTAGGETGMFDEVSGRFFASGGTALTAGADLDAARYGWVRAESKTYSLNATTPVAALWTGAGRDAADLADPDNWICRNVRGETIDGAVPTEDTDVTVRAPATFAVTSGVTFACKSVLFDNAALACDIDLRGLPLAKIAGGSSVNVAGNILQLRGPDGASPSSIAIGDVSADAENPGTVRIDVPHGATFDNTAIALSGNLRFAKSGAGTYIASKGNQAYTGGSIVEAGTLKFGTSGNELPFGARNSPIEVSANAVLDAYSRHIEAYHIVLAGGTFANTFNGISANMDSNIGNLTLKADSLMLFDTQGSYSQDRTILDGAVWDLGGHTLTVTFQGKDPDVWFKGKFTLKNGTVKTNPVTPDAPGWWQDHETDGTQGGSYDIGTRIRHDGTSTVSNLTFRTTSDSIGDPAKGLYKVYGTFTPLSQYWHNVQMLDGSTIDISSKTGTWNATCTASGKSWKVNFADDAKVTVNLAGRKDLRELAASDTPYVIAWAAEPAGAEFEPDPQTKALHATLKQDSTGLRISFAGGMMLIIR